MPAPAFPDKAVPDRLLLACGLCLLTAVLWLHREVLFGGLVYHMDDAADGYYPSHVAIKRAFSAFELPTWERGAWTGFPLLADPYYGAFYPLSLTFYLFGAVRGLGVNIALHMLLGALGMLCLLRRRGLASGPALFGAVALGFSTFMVERIRHIIFPQHLALLPWVLYFAEGVLQSDRRRERVLLALSLGLALLCGALPLLPFVALCLGAYLLPRALSVGPQKLVPLALCAACGVLVAMAQIVPSLAHLPHSPRQLGAAYAFASSYAWPDYRYAALLYLPDLFGGTERGQWLGVYNHWELAGYYVGLWPALLVPLGLLRHRGRPELVGLFVVAVLAVLLAFGDATPVHRLAFHHVPIYGALRCPARALFMFLLAAPILGAEGLAWLLSRPFPRRRRLLTALFFALALVLLGALLSSYLSRPAPRLVPLAAAMRRACGHGALVLCAGLGALCLWALGALGRQAAALLLALVSLLDLLAVNRGYVQPRPADFAEGTERFAAVDWLAAKGPTERFAIDAQGPFRLHNLGLVLGLEGVSGYDSYSIWRYVQYLHVLNTGAPYPHKQLRHDPAAGDVRRFDSPLLDLLHVRWYIGPRQPAPDWIERFRTQPGAKLHARHEPLWDPQLAVYENPHPLPRAFVVYGAEVVAASDAQARALARLDPRKAALLEEAPVPAPEGAGRELSPARLVRAERHRLVIEAEAQAAGVLVISEAHYPGWTAMVDGRPAKLLRANYAFRGVALPPGHHTVELHFTSRPTQIGLLLSALGLLSLFLLGLLGRPKADARKEG